MSEKKTVKVYNLTDIATPKLVQYGLVDQTIAAGRVLVGPGECVEVEMDEHTAAVIRGCVSQGALAVDRLPPEYAVAKDREATLKKVEEKVESAKKTAAKGADLRVDSKKE